MKSITIATILLVVVFALAVVGFAQPRPEGFEPGMGEGPREPGGFMAELPDLTDEQIEAIEALHENLRKEMETVHAEKEALHEAFRMEMQKPEPNINTVRELRTEMDAIEMEILISHLELRQGTRELLTDDQQAFFDEMQRGMGSHGPHHGGGRPMHDGPPPGGPGSGDAPRDGSGRG